MDCYRNSLFSRSSAFDKYHNDVNASYVSGVFEICLRGERNIVLITTGKLEIMTNVKQNLQYILFKCKTRASVLAQLMFYSSFMFPFLQ